LKSKKNLICNSENFCAEKATILSRSILDSFHKLSDTWHPHVYARPPKQPTPFSINNILQQNIEPSWRDQRKEEKEIAYQVQAKSLISFFGANPITFPFAQVRKSLFKSYNLGSTLPWHLAWGSESRG